MKVSTCDTKVDMLKAELAQSRKDLDHAKEETASMPKIPATLITLELRFSTLLEADEINRAPGRKGEQAIV